MPSIFDRVRLRPSQLRTIAERRYADAECLRKSGDNERANGAMYLAGFVVECLLKAKLLDQHPWLQGPLSATASAEEQRLWSLCYRSHDLEEILAHLPGLTRTLAAEDAAEAGRGSRLRSLRNVCARWTVHARYSPQSETDGSSRTPSGRGEGAEKMSEVTTAPEALGERLAESLRDGLARIGIQAAVETEPVPHTLLHRAMVTSPQFGAMEWSERQDLIWRMLDEYFTREEQLFISSVWTMTPDEIDGNEGSTDV